MSDNYEIVLLATADGVVRAFQSVSAVAKTTAADLTKVGTAGDAALKKAAGAASQTVGGLDKVAASSGKLGEASGNAEHALVRAATASSRFAREIGAVQGPLGQIAALVPGASHGFLALGAAVDTLSGAGGLASLVAAINPVTLGITAAVAVGALAIKSFQDQAQAAQDLTDANKALNESILANVSASNLQAAGGIQAQAFAPKTALDQAPWTDLGKKIGLAVQNGIASQNTDLNQIILRPEQVAQVEQLQSQIFSGVNKNQGDQTQAIAAQKQLIDSYNQTKILGSDVIDVETKIAAAEAETGTRGQVAQQQLDKLNAEFARTGDVNAYKKGIDDVAASLGQQALKEQAAAAAAKSRIDAQIQGGLSGSSQVGQFNLTQAANDQAASQALANARAINAAAAANQAEAQSYTALENTRGRNIDQISNETATMLADRQERERNIAAIKAQEDAYTAMENARAQGGANIVLAHAPEGLTADQAEKAAQQIVQADQAVEAAAQKRAAAVQDAANTEIDAVNKTADAQVRAAEQAGHAQSLDLKNAGRDTVRAAQTTANSQIRAATLAQNQQTNAARRAADAQIAAAQDAADAQTQAAKDAADAQVSEAERAEHAQVRSAQVAANEQIRAANAAAHDQVAQAQKAAHEQTAAADRLVTQVTNDAKAQADATIQSAQQAHDAAVAQANKTADAEIAAAKRSADQAIIQLQRRTQAAQDNARDQANKALQQANDQAARAIRGGADPGKVAKNLADAQKKAYADQEKAQENATSRQQRQQDAIQAKEQQKIDSINAYKEQATKAADDRLQAIQDQAQAQEQARVAAATKQAEAMKKQAAQNVAQVERATTQQTNDIERAANRSVEEAKRQAAKQTEAAKVAIAKNEADQEKAIQANLQATTDAANRQAEKVATDTARNTARVRTDAERTVQRAQADTAHQQTQLARQTDQTVRQIDNARKKRIDDITKATDDQTKAIEADAKRQEAAFTLAAAKADPLVAKALQLHDVISKGADGQYHFILGEADQTAIKDMQDAIAMFGPDHRLDLAAAAHVTVQADFGPFNQQIANVAGKTVADVKVAVQPYGTPQNPARLPAAPAGPHALGGYVAANGRLVTMNEYGPEQVILPGGSVIVPHPASAADPAGKGWPDIHIHGDVYGMDDFEGKVQRAAMNGLARGLPAAIAARRRSLGAA